MDIIDLGHTGECANVAKIVRVPGSCGELVQGRIAGQDFLVTCPIALFSFATAGPADEPRLLLPYKARAALQELFRRFPVGENWEVHLHSELLDGKGMASSSADIAAVCAAVARAAGISLTPADLAELALAVEPSDATFYPGIVRFDYLCGRWAEPVGTAPQAYLHMYDAGGTVDTVQFNARTDLVAKRDAQESVVREALALLREGLATGDLRKIGAAATASARANQTVLPRPYLEDLIRVGAESGGTGIVIAHSGTVCGILAASPDSEAVRARMDKEFGTTLTYLDSVRLCDGGVYWDD